MPLGRMAGKAAGRGRNAMFVWLGKSCSVDANTGSVACSSTINESQPKPQRKWAEPDILAHLRNWPTSVVFNGKQGSLKELSAGVSRCCIKRRYVI